MDNSGNVQGSGGLLPQNSSSMVIGGAPSQTTGTLNDKEQENLVSKLGSVVQNALSMHVKARENMAKILSVLLLNQQ
eukprot:5684119-Karenia_brevis.AAC.3